jgi:hypothetical protein
MVEVMDNFYMGARMRAPTGRNMFRPAPRRMRRGERPNEEKAPAPTSGCRRRMTVALAWEGDRLQPTPGMP